MKQREERVQVNCKECDEGLVLVSVLKLPTLYPSHLKVLGISMHISPNRYVTEEIFSLYSKAFLSNAKETSLLSAKPSHTI
jgi:hypothetical protein